MTHGGPSRGQALIGELGRRHVFRVAAIYAVVGWVLVQVADTVFPRLALPDWSATLVIVLVAIGFPLALVLAWAYDLGPAGIQRTAGAEAIAGVASPVAPAVSPASSASPLPAPADSSPPDDHSIAVLPFVNMSPDAGNEHFSDGLTEEIMADLCMVRALRVTSRTSVMTYKGSSKGAREIGRELGVRYLLEGSVRRAGDSLRVTAQLIDAEGDVHLWSDKLTGDLDDVFAFQERISRHIVDALRVQLTADEDRRLATRSTADVEVFDLYLQARQEMWRFRQESLEVTDRLVREGLARDPDNALLHCVLGTVHAMRVAMRFSGDLTELDRAERHAARAAQMDNGLPQLHVLRGIIAYGRKRMLESARHFLAALEISPSNPDALLWIAFHMVWSGRVDEARPYANRLRLVDPLSAHNLNLYGMVALLDGRPAEAAVIAREWVTREPEAFLGWVELAVAHVHAGRHDDALAVLEEASPFCAAVPPARAMIELLHAALTGDRAGVLQTLEDEGVDALREDEFCGLVLGGPLALVGEVGPAVEWLRRGIENGALWYQLIDGPHTLFAALRAHPEFGSAVAEMRRRSQQFRV
jgi:adenylate cyclase